MCVGREVKRVKNMGARSSSRLDPAHLLLLFLIHSVLTLITNFPSGFTNSTVNTAVEQLHSFIADSYVSRGWAITGNQVLWIQSAILNVWFVSQVFGAMVSPFFADHYGRKKGYIIGISVTVLSSVVQAVSVHVGFPELLAIGRGLTAFASPLCDTCLIMYIQETAPVEIRGMLSFLPEIGYGAMCVLGSILGMPDVLGGSLRVLLLVALLPEVLSLIFLFFIPETPKFLMIMRSDAKAARKSLVFFQGERKEHELTLVNYMREREDDVSDEDQSGSSLKEVFSRPELRQAIMLGSSVLVLTLSFYPMLQSSTYIFVKSGIPKNISEMSSTGLLILFTIASCFGSFLIDRYPRRVLILVAGISSNLFLLSFSVFATIAKDSELYRIAILVSIAGYCLTFGSVLGPISWFVAPELVSQRHKSTVFSTCYAIGNILIACTNFSVIPMYKCIGGLTFIPLFVIPSCLCLVFLYCRLPETLGRETADIVAEMTRKWDRVRDADDDVQTIRF